MVMFVIFVLGPALTFNLYALTHFWREGKRAATGYFRRREVPVTFITERTTRGEEYSPALYGGVVRTAALASRSVLQFVPRGKRPTQRHVA